MSSYFLTRQAATDLSEIHDFITSDDPTAALRFLDLLEEKLQTISSSPEMGRNRQELAQGLRSFPVGHYMIFYRPSEKGIQVMRILHGARDIEVIFEQ